MMGGGQNFIFFGSTPGPFACQAKTHPCQAPTVSYSWVQYIAPSIWIWLITSSKTERACTNIYARSLDFVRYGRVGLMEMGKIISFHYWYNSISHYSYNKLTSKSMTNLFKNTARMHPIFSPTLISTAFISE